MSKYQLTKAERETIITYDEEGIMATIYTCHKPLKRKLESCCAKNKGFKLVSWDEYSSTYEIPKQYVSIRCPKVISDEKRAEMANQARRQFTKQKMIAGPQV